VAHFGAGFVGREHPFDAGAGGVSLSFHAAISLMRRTAIAYLFRKRRET
jgi:hypothetical protein